MGDRPSDFLPHASQSSALSGPEVKRTAQEMTAAYRKADDWDACGRKSESSALSGPEVKRTAQEMTAAYRKATGAVPPSQPTGAAEQMLDALAKAKGEVDDDVPLPTDPTARAMVTAYEKAWRRDV
jgi:hypothetical protein